MPDMDKVYHVLAVSDNLAADDALLEALALGERD